MVADEDVEAVPEIVLQTWRYGPAVLRVTFCQAVVRHPETVTGHRVDVFPRKRSKQAPETEHHNYELFEQ